MKTPITKEIENLRRRKRELEELKRLHETVSALEMEEFNKTETGRTFAVILEECCRFFRVQPSVVLSYGRTHIVVDPRFTTYYIANHFYGMRLTVIARLIGRNHGAIHNGVNTMRDRNETEQAVRDNVQTIREAIQARLGTGNVISLSETMKMAPAGIQSARNGNLAHL